MALLMCAFGALEARNWISQASFGLQGPYEMLVVTRIHLSQAKMFFEFSKGKLRNVFGLKLHLCFLPTHDENLARALWRLTFDITGNNRVAKPAGYCPVDGRVSQHSRAQRKIHAHP